jgi:hypothetical protein
MSTSPTHFLSDPVPGERISHDTLHYWRARAKREAYDLVLGEFLKSKMTKTELAKRMGKTLPEVSRILGGPANWTINTVADLLFAIAGGVPKWGMMIPRRNRRNDKRPNWLELDLPILKASTKSQSANTAPVVMVGQPPAPPSTQPQQNLFGLGQS